MSAKVYAVGVGVGKSGFLTLDAYDILKKSDVIVVPQSKKSKRSAALKVIERYIEKDKISMFYFPTTNNDDELKKAYDDEAAKIKSFVDKQKSVAYVTIGDVSIYSTFNYLADRIKKYGIDIEIAAGIPSFIALSDKVGVPLVLKGESFAIVEMNKGVDYILKLFELVDSIAVLKINNRIDELFEIKNKIELEYAYIGTKLYMEDEKIRDLLTAQKEEIKNAYLSLAVLKKK